MKKELLMLFMILLVLPLVSAVNFDMKSNFQPGETLLGTLEGNFLSQLTQQNFYFYSDRSQIPLLFDIAKIQDKYYFYALLPAEEGNYTLIIRDAKYYENGKEVQADLEKNFTVSGNISDFSVYPGFIIMKNESSLSVESKSQPLAVSAVFMGSTQTVQVPIAQKKKLSFSAQGVNNFTLTSIQLSALNTKYSIPVAILSSSPENKTSVLDEFRFSDSKYAFSVYEKNRSSFKIYLQNLGKNKRDNIRLIYSDTLKGTIAISPENITQLNGAEFAVINIIIEAKTYKTFQGTLTAYSGNESAETFITINSIESGKPLPANTNIQNKLSSCAEINGIICDSGQSCSGELRDSIEGLGICCTNGLCEENKSYWGTIIGIILIIAVAGALYYLYRRSKKANITSEDIMRKTTKKFEERNSEIRGSLAKS